MKLYRRERERGEREREGERERGGREREGRRERERERERGERERFLADINLFTWRDHTMKAVI